MNAKMMCRTAIGLFAASVAIQSATAQNCPRQTAQKSDAKQTIQNNKGEYFERSSIPCLSVMMRPDLLIAESKPPERLWVRKISEFTEPIERFDSVPAISAAAGTNAIQIGTSGAANEAEAIAIGPWARAEFAAAVAIGSRAVSKSLLSLAIGTNSTVETGASHSFALGSYATISTGASQSAALGGGSYVGLPLGLALGYGARSEARSAVALGAFSVADEDNTISVGREDNPDTSFDDTILRRITKLDAGISDTDAVNYAELKSAIDALELGVDYFAVTATGTQARADAPNSMAFGPNSFAGAGGAVAFDNGAKSLFVDSYAIGSNAQTSRNSQFMFGTRLSNYSMPGLINPRSRMLQSGDLELDTVDESGTIAGDGGITLANLRLDISANGEGIKNLNHQITDHAARIHTGEVERGALAKEVDTLDQQVAQNSTSIAGLEQSVAKFSDLPEDVYALNQEVAEQSASLESIEQTLLNDVARTEDVGALDRKIAKNSTSIANLEQSVAANAGLPEDVAALNDEVTQQTASLTNIEQALANDVARIEDVDTVSRKVDENAATIADLERSVAETAGLPKDVETLNQTVDEHSTDIADIQRSLSEGVAMSEETAEQLDVLENNVSKNTNGIDQNAESIMANRNVIEGNSTDIARLEDQAIETGERFETVQTQMSEHETRMDSVDKSLTVHAGRISANTQSVESVKAVATENQTRIARNQAALAEQGEAISVLQSDIERLGLNMYGLAQTVAHQSQQIETNKTGVAIANALAGSSWLQANETVAFTLNAGYFEGRSAFAFSGTKRLHDQWSANVAIGTDTDQGKLGARAGLRLGW